MERHFNIVVWGKVQGVGYREGIKKKAIDLGIRGYVKNLPNGTVFIEAEGEEEQLNQLINWCHNGPSKSEVTSVKYSVAQTQNFEGFEVKD
jgi:acylphosphatase